MVVAGSLPLLPASAATLITSYASFDCWPSAAAAAEQQMPLAVVYKTCQTHGDVDVIVLQWQDGTGVQPNNHLIPTIQSLVT